jgi:hypothetical protein
MTEIQRESFPFRLHWQESSELLVLVSKALWKVIFRCTERTSMGRQRIRKKMVLNVQSLPE